MDEDTTKAALLSRARGIAEAVGALDWISAHDARAARMNHLGIWEGLPAWAVQAAKVAIHEAAVSRLAELLPSEEPK